MGQTYVPEIVPTQGLTPAALDMTNNFESLRSSFSGASPPSAPSPVAGQLWHCTSTGGGFTSGVTYIYSGSTWIAIGTVGGATPGAVSVLSTIVGIDGAAVGTTPLLTTPSKRAVVTRIDLEVTALSAITANPEMGAGVAAGEDDVCAPVDFSLFTVVSSIGQIFSLESNAISRVVETTDTFRLGIDTAAAGTTLTLTARTSGYTI